MRRPAVVYGIAALALGATFASGVLLGARHVAAPQGLRHQADPRR